MKRLLWVFAGLLLLLAALFYFWVAMPTLLNAGEIGFMLGIVCSVGGFAALIYLANSVIKRVFP